MQQSPDEFGGTRLVATAACEPGQRISTVPLHRCLCILQGSQGPQQLRSAIDVDVQQVHKQWQAESALHWPAALAQHINDGATHAADRLVTWLSWLQLHAPENSCWRTWVDSLPERGSVQLARHASPESLQHVRSRQLRKLCESERRAHEARWERMLQQCPNMWPGPDKLRLARAQASDGANGEGQCTERSRCSEKGAGQKMYGCFALLMLGERSMLSTRLAPCLL